MLRTNARRGRENNLRAGRRRRILIMDRNIRNYYYSAEDNILTLESLLLSLIPENETKKRKQK